MTSLPLVAVTPGARLFHALSEGRDSVRSLLAHPLGDEIALIAAARAASARAVDRAGVAGAAVHRLESLGAPASAVAAAARLGDPAAAVVVAGQQPALVMGPHLVLSKALTAIAVARRLERSTGRPVVPVYWSASEDHDHGEVDHVSVASAAGGSVRLRAALPADRTMLSATPVPESVNDALDQLGALLPDGPGRRLLDGLLPPRPADTWGDWTTRQLATLLGPLGVAVLEPDTVRPFATEVLRHEALHPGDLHASVAGVEARLAVAGLPPALGLLHPELFFAVSAGRRLRPTLDGQRWVLGDGTTCSREELADLVVRQPGRFSWNVVTRVLAQDLALPVAAQVCGPSELGYVAATRPAHERLGIPVPALIPRPGVTVVDPGVERAAAALGVSLADVVARGAAAFEGVVAERPASLSALWTAVEELPESNDKAVARRRAGLVQAVEQYQSALEREAQTRADTVAARRTRVLEALRPGGGLQERSWSALPWIARHGPEFLERWLEAVGMPGAGHTLLRTAADGVASVGGPPSGEEVRHG